MTDELFEQGKTHFEDEKFAQAKECFEKVVADSSASEGLVKKGKMWIRKCDLELEKSGGAAAAAPSPKEENKVEEKKQDAPAPAPAAAAETPAPKPKAAVRHDWFQSLGNITLNFFVKNRKKEDVEVHVEPKCFDITVKLDDGNTFTYSFDPLFGEVDPASVKVDVRPIKIEVIINKKVQAQWATLEAPEGQLAAVQAPTASSTSTTAKDLPKAYSGKARDWSKEIEYEEDKPTGEAATNAFFKEIYSGAGADQQRAMMKSFQESGGTVLSTNWQEVGSKKVEVQAPNGMEAKKWEQ